MKTISQHLGQIILAVAAVALIVGVVLTFGSPVHNFMDGVMDKLYEVGNGPIWNVGGTTTNPDEGGSGDSTPDDSVLGLRRFKGDKIFSQPQISLEGIEYTTTVENHAIVFGSILIEVPEMGETGRICAIGGKVLQVTPETEEVPIGTDFPIGMRFDTVDEGNGVTEWINGTGIFNITKCDNETAKAWLLANTEPVEASEEGDSSTETESIVGTWVFNEKLYGGDYAYLGFVCSDVDYSLIDTLVVDDTTNETYDVTYTKAAGGVLKVYSMGEWVNEKYRTITITSEPNNPEFVTWLKANAKRVIEVNELPTEDIDTSAIYQINELVEDTDTSTLLGTWVFNETINVYNDYAPLPFDITVDGVAYTENYCWSIGTTIQFKLATSGVDDLVVYENTWLDNSYRTMVISNVSGDYADEWLQSNATKYKTVEKYYQYVDGAWVEQ